MKTIGIFPSRRTFLRSVVVVAPAATAAGVVGMSVASALSTTAVDALKAPRHVVGNDIAGRDTDVGAATSTTTSHARWSAVFAISGDTAACGSPER